MPVIGKGVQARAQVLLDHLAATWTVKDDGGLSTQDMSISFFEAAFVQLLDASKSKLSESGFRKCAYGALRSILKRRVASVDAFEEAFAKEERSVSRGRKNRYFLVTRSFVTIHGLDWLPLELWGDQMVMSHGLPSAIRTDEFFLSGYGRVRPAEPTFGLFCTVPLQARNPQDALDRGGVVVSTIFGALNFWTSVGNFSLYSGPPKVGAEVFPGKYLIVHTDQFERFEEVISFYENTPGTSKTLNASMRTKVGEFHKFTTILAKVGKKDRAFYQAFFRLYFDFLTEIEFENQVVKLWRLAEFATFSQGQNAEQIARRLALTWDKPEAIYALCTAFGHLRNTIVHGSSVSHRMNELVEYFQFILELHIWSSLHVGDELDVWKRALEIGGSGIDVDMAERAHAILRKLRR